MAKQENLRGIDWQKRVHLSSGRRLTRVASVGNPICKYGAPFFKPTPSFALKKALEAGLGAFCDKQENLRGTGRLHALVYIFVALFDALAELEDSISSYGRPFFRLIV